MIDLPRLLLSADFGADLPLALAFNFGLLIRRSSWGTPGATQRPRLRGSLGAGARIITLCTRGATVNAHAFLYFSTLENGYE